MAEAKSKEKPKHFRAWLSQFVEEESPLGDLARDAGADSDWKGNTRKSLKERLIDENADFAAFEALTEASKRYAEEMSLSSPEGVRVPSLGRKRKADSQSKNRKSPA